MQICVDFFCFPIPFRDQLFCLGSLKSLNKLKMFHFSCSRFRCGLSAVRVRLECGETAGLKCSICLIYLAYMTFCSTKGVMVTNPPQYATELTI